MGMRTARTLSVTPYGVPAPPKGGAFCICRSAQIKLPLRGSWHRTAMTERVCLFTEGIVTESVLALSGANAPALPRGEPLAVHANFISLPRSLPLRKDFPRAGGRCRAATKGGVWHGAAVTERASPLKYAAAACPYDPPMKKWLRNARRRF